jgi:diguanylate cyclase (GGDEF)-like protein
MRLRRWALSGGALSAWAPSAWALWSLPRRVLVPILGVELAVIVVLVVQVGYLRPELPPGWAITAAVLAGAGMVSTEASLNVERRRHYADSRPHIDLSSVWAFAAAALLPGPPAVGVVVVIYGHLYLRAWLRQGAPHRVVYSISVIVLAALAASAVVGTVELEQRFSSVPGLLVVVAGLLVYGVVNMLLVVAAMVLSRRSHDAGTLREALGRWDEAVLEFATLSMGALAAGAMAAFGPVYAIFVLPTLIVLHRTVLVHQLEREASTDGKTGLLNAAGWHVHADRALRRSERADAQATVLVLDVDHFKEVNDRYGHLVGDEVLSAVAAEIEAEVREEDLVGRFGGEEFVVLLVGLDGDHDPVAARAVAERIRNRIAELEVPVRIGRSERTVVVDKLTVSIGGATFPADGSELLQLVEGADTAMYAAKRAGRNRIRIGVEPEPVPSPGS